jgi:hypothetical protein
MIMMKFIDGWIAVVYAAMIGVTNTGMAVALGGRVEDAIENAENCVWDGAGLTIIFKMHDQSGFLRILSCSAQGFTVRYPNSILPKSKG